jgi:hypothetical protein
VVDRGQYSFFSGHRSSGFGVAVIVILIIVD